MEEDSEVEDVVEMTFRMDDFLDSTGCGGCFDGCDHRHFQILEDWDLDWDLALEKKVELISSCLMMKEWG